MLIARPTTPLERAVDSLRGSGYFSAAERVRTTTLGRGVGHLRFLREPQRGGRCDRASRRKHAITWRSTTLHGGHPLPVFRIIFSAPGLVSSQREA